MTAIASTSRGPYLLRIALGLLLCAGAVGVTPVSSAEAQSRRREVGVRGHEIVELGGQAGLLYRQLRYNDDLFGFLRDYELQHAKAFGGYVELFPLARALPESVVGRLGVELRHTQMLPFDSTRSDGAEFLTRSHEFIVGVRLRVLRNELRERGFGVSVGLGYAQQRFAILSAIAMANTDNRASVPSVFYRAVRLHASGRVPLEAGFFLTGHLGLRIIADAGDIDADVWFPRARRAGIEAGLHLGYVLGRGVELLAGFESRRYFYNLRPEPGDSFIAGGLLDRYVVADARIGFRY